MLRRILSSVSLTWSKELADEILRLHRNSVGGFHDIRHDKSRSEPASLRFPLTVLAQNAATAAFFVGLADLTGDLRYRMSWTPTC